MTAQGHTATLSVWSAQGEALGLSEGAGISWDDQASGLLTFGISADSADQQARAINTPLAIERDADSEGACACARRPQSWVSA